MHAFVCGSCPLEQDDGVMRLIELLPADIRKGVEDILHSGVSGDPF